MVGVDGEVERAWERARRLYPLSAGFQRAYVRGARAAAQGKPASGCPYRSTRGWKAWRSAWTRGFNSIAARRTR